MIDGLDVVAIGIEHERRVIAGMVMTLARRAVVAAAGGECSRMETLHGCAVGRLEGDAHDVHGEAFDAPFVVNGTELYLTASLGIATFPAHASDSTELLTHADAAMYQSKRVAPGGYAVYADDVDNALGKLSLSTRLRKAGYSSRRRRVLTFRDPSALSLPAPSLRC